MTRCCIVNKSNNVVTNVVDYDVVPQGTPPGMDDTVMVVASTTGQIGHLFNNGVFTDPNPPAQPVSLTLDQIYDQTILNERVLKAIVLALNDGTLPVGTNKTGAQLKAIIKAKM